MTPTQKKPNLSSMKEDLGNINNGGGNSSEYGVFEEEIEEHNNINNGGDDEEEDRLSSLPDNLLITILSLLSIEFAAATSVLSHRWRYIWTHCTHLSFSSFGCYYGRPKINNFQKLIPVVGHILSQICSPTIHTFNLRTIFGIQNDENRVCSSFLVPWITQICFRNPEVILIDFGNISYPTYFFELPDCLFTTQSLVVLQLPFRYEWKFPDDNSDDMLINLPNLKKLNMGLCDSNRTLMRTLFKSCPLLVYLSLFVRFKEKDHFVDIVAPNLKDLEIHMESYSHKCIFSIDAPNLENFGITGPLPFYHFVNNPRAQQEAIVNIPDYYSDQQDDYLSRMIPLFLGISCARYLTFNNFSGLYLMDVTLPIFHNLINLTIGVCLLESDSQVPSCLLSNLKMLQISDMEPNGRGIKLLEEFLSNATVLEQLDVFVYSYSDKYGVLKNKVWMEYKFCMKLFTLPRSSSNCLINFSGSVITASSNDFKDGRLACEITDLIEVE